MGDSLRLYHPQALLIKEGRVFKTTGSHTEAPLLNRAPWSDAVFDARTSRHFREVA